MCICGCSVPARIVPGEQSTQFPTAPLGWVVPGDPGIPSTLAPTHYDNLGPRVGLAYSPGFADGVLGKIFGGPGKTSIRAAYGIYYTSIEDLNLFYEVGDAPYGLYWVSPEPTMFAEPFRNARRWRLAGNAALCMQLNAEGATDLSTGATNPACGTYGEQDTYQLPNGTKVYGTGTNLGPAFGAGNTFTANFANSNYNAFQATVERKAADVTFLVAYAFSKAIDDSSGFGEWVNFANLRRR